MWMSFRIGWGQPIARRSLGLVRRLVRRARGAAGVRSGLLPSRAPSPSERRLPRTVRSRRLAAGAGRAVPVRHGGADAHARRDGARLEPRVRRRIGRERRAARDPTGPRGGRRGDAVGDERVSRRARRARADRRRERGSARAPSRVRRRRVRVHCGLDRLRVRIGNVRPRRGARGAGRRRRPARSGEPGAARRDFPGGRASTCNRGVGGLRRARDGGRPDARRVPDRSRVVARDLLSERPARRRGGVVRAARRTGQPERASAGPRLARGEPRRRRARRA